MSTYARLLKKEGAKIPIIEYMFKEDYNIAKVLCATQKRKEHKYGDQATSFG